MKLLGLLSAISLFFFLSCSSDSPVTIDPSPKDSTPPSATVPPTSVPNPIKNSNAYNDGPVVLFGDSLAKGFGSSSPDKSLEGCLKRASRRETLNVARNGDTSEGALSKLATTAQLKPSLVLVSLGGNDVMRDAGLFEIPAETTHSNLREIFKTLTSAGSLVIHLGIDPPRESVPRRVDPSRLHEIKPIAAQEGVIFSERSLQNLWGDRQYMFDLIHPNDEGYAIVCDRLKAALAPHFKIYQ